MKSLKQILLVLACAVLFMGMSGAAALADEGTAGAANAGGTVGPCNTPADSGTVAIADKDVYTDHSQPLIKEYEMPSWSETGASVETDTQKAHLSLKYEEKMKIVDSSALTNELMNVVKIHNMALGAGNKMGTVQNVKLSEDRQTLKFDIVGWQAPYSGLITSAGTLSSLTSLDGSKKASADFELLMPNGLTTRIMKQNIADETHPASVTTKILAPKSATRGMVHLLVLKNGMAVPNGNGEFTSYGATATGHWHDYMTMIASDFVKYYSGALADALGSNYTLTTDGDKITITAKNSSPGDVLELHVLSYLNNGTKTIDTTQLAQTVSEAQSSTPATDELKAELDKDIRLAQLILNKPSLYAQTDVDTAVSNLQSVMSGTIPVPGDEDDGSLARTTPLLKLQVKASGKTTQKLTWSKVSGATGYKIYYARSGKKMKSLKTVKGTSLTKKKLKKGKIYKYRVYAVKKVNGKQKTLAASLLCCSITGNYSRTYTNARSLKASKKSLTMASGKTAKISAKTVKYKKSRKLLKKSLAPTYRFQSSNTNIASVSSSGKITAKKAGKCTIYIFAQNGVRAAVAVTVR
ncbi:MAG: Ig-like domain-containing protein [Anaerovoracaceae bacterium]|jgi:hypothetical protein